MRTQRVYDDRFIHVDELPGEKAVLLRRLPEHADDLDVLIASYGEALLHADKEVRYHGWSLIIDMREAPGRNDPDFERAGSQFRRRAREVFSTVVVLVATATGALQIKRLAREDRVPFLVAHDLDEALRICANERRRAT